MAKKTFDPEKVYISSRLRSALDRMKEFPLTVIEAPLGCGKTTALRTSLASSGMFYSWITAVPGTGEYFWEKFCQALEAVDMAMGEKMSGCTFPRTMEEACRTADILREAAPARDTFIVIDDYQHIYSEEMAELFSAFARAEVPKIHLILSGRQRFLLDREELRLKSRLFIIDEKIIRMETEDIQEYYRACGVSVSRREASCLYKKTNGWTAALYMNLMDGKGELRTEIPHGAEDLLDYAICRNLTEDQMDFLQRISVFPSFTMEQARFVRRKRDPGPALKQLTDSCAFLFFDPDRREYTMNPILRKHLRGLLEKREIRFRNEVYRNAADWYYLNREYGRSAFCYYRSGHYEDTLKAFERDCGKSLSGSELRTVDLVYSACPEKIRERHPLALLIYARQLRMNGEWERLEEVTDLLKKKTVDGSLQGGDLRRFRGESCLLKGFCSYADPSAMIDAQREAAGLLDESSRTVSRQSVWAFGSPSILYLFYSRSGSLETLCREFSASRSLYYRMTDNNSRGSEYLLEAELHFYRGDLQRAQILSNKALNVAERYEQAEIVLSSLFLKARTALLSGDGDRGKEALNRMRSTASSGSRMYRAAGDICEAALYSVFNQTEAIASWIADGRFMYRPVPGVYGIIKDYLNVIYSRVLLNRLDYSGYLGISRVMLEEAAGSGHLLSVIYFQIFEAIACRKIGMYEQSERALQEAVSLASKDGLVIPFVENGSGILELLKRIAFREEEYQFVQQCIKLSEKYERSLNVMLSPGGMSPLSLLTRREQEISLLVAEGKTNIQIARELNIAEITVKKCLSNIYARLGVANRTSLLKKIME